MINPFTNSQQSEKSSFRTWIYRIATNHVINMKKSRAEKKVYAFLKEKCGLINKSNPCHCEKKTKTLIDSGIIDPNKI